ncbi:MAG: type I methionyl aminopeptidase [Actinobacteria bacterium]|nr:type I methionyl aminopeptidase [Actinomycetota bacterium]
MRRAGQVVAEMHEAIRAAIRPGVTTASLDAIGRAVLARRGATSNFLGYHGYPAVICASVNDEVVHGIPGDRILDDGDVISVDCGAIVQGWHGDAAFTVGVGSIDASTRRLIDLADASLEAGIATLMPEGRLGDYGAVVSGMVDAAGCASAEGFTGHGIGRAMHEAPAVPNEARAGTGPRLRVGNVLALEPMICAGSGEVMILDDGWTAVTVDGSRAVHVEHTVAVTEDGPEILTRP